MASGHASPRAILTTKIVFTALAGLLTVARLYTRTQIVRNAGLDDLFIGISLIASAILSVTTYMQVHYGMGSHYNTLDPANNSDAMFWFWLSVIVYSLALGCGKVSILLQYLRILPRSVRAGPMDERCSTNKYRIATLIMICVVSVYTVFTVVSAIFTCFPVQSFWRVDISGRCLPRNELWYANAGVNIATEICTVLIPLPVLWNLPVPKRQKYILLFVFGVAGITVVISILRLPFLYILAISEDKTWDSPIASILSSLEVNIGIMASCIPTLKGLVCRMFPSQCEERAAAQADATRNRNAFDENDMEDLGGSVHTGDQCSVQSSAGTATHLNATYFNATARLDDDNDPR